MADDNAAGRGTARLEGLGAWTRRGLAVAAGASAALGLAPWGVWPATLAGLFAILALHATARTSRSAFMANWLAGTGYFAVALFWIVEPFFVDVARHGWMAPFALVFMAMGMALFWGVAGTVAARVGGDGGAGRALAWAAALSLAEWLRGVVLTGFPWAMIGHVWIDTPALSLAAWVGPAGLTALTLLVVATGWIAILKLVGPSRVVFVLLPFGLFGALAFAAVQEAPDVAPDAPVIRVVQPNAPQREKWDPDRALVFYARAVDFTAAGDPADLTIWPETSIPWLLEDASPALEQIARAADERPVVVGLRRLDGARAYNSLVVTGEGGRVAALYDKHHLVPFGEYIPLGQLAQLAGLRSFAARDGYGYSAGPGAQILDLGLLGSVLPMICYETIFPRNVRNAAERPDWIMQITNDAWFGRISGPYQHLAQARFRAAEQGLPVIRAANTGVSAVIDARGQVAESLPLGEAGYFDQPLPAALPRTLYAWLGDWPTLAVLLAVLAATGLTRRRFSD